ncbi:MAG: hypothetical protein Q9183_005458 [Haloplaca sp. 2 TL-2023]
MNLALSRFNLFTAVMSNKSMEANKGIISRLTQGLESGKYSDLTILCRGHEFPVHRVVLCTASKFFAAACDGPYKEAQNATIDLSEDDPQALKRMLRFLYTANYRELDEADLREEALQSPVSLTRTPNTSATPSNPKTPTTSTHKSTISPSPLPSLKRKRVDDNKSVDTTHESKKRTATAALNNALVYALAEKYNIKDLKDVSRTKFAARALNGSWNGTDILTTINTVYSTTPAGDRGLRDSILSVYARNHSRLLQNPELPTLLTKDSELALDVLKTVTGTLEGENTFLQGKNSSLKHSIEEWQRAARKTQEVLEKTSRDASRTSK